MLYLLRALFSSKYPRYSRRTLDASSWTIRVVLLFFVVCVLASPVKAAFVTFSGTGYVSGTELLAGNTPAHSFGGSDQYGEPDGWTIGPAPTALVGRAFSDSTAFNPASNYFGPAFFGGGLVNSTDGPTNEGFHELSMANGGGGDSIHWQVDSNGTNTHTNHVFVYFKKAQFDSPWNGIGTITSASLAPGAFTMHTGQLSQAGPSDITALWVVKNGSSFYVSQNSLLIAQNTGYQTNFAAITGWALYDPTSSLSALDFDETSTFTAQTFTDVQGFGFYVEHENGSQQTHVDIDSFIVSTVPEPSSYMLAGTAAMAMFFLRRRRKNIAASQRRGKF